MTNATYQEELLLKRARETGCFADVVYFRAVRRDMEGVRELRDEPGAAFVHDVVMLDAEPDAWAGVAQRLPDEDDPWAHYTCAKFLLARGRIEETMQLVRDRVSRHPRDTRVLNLVVKCLVNRGERQLAAALAERSLRLSPDQEDIEQIRKTLATDEHLTLTVYLDLLPRLESVGYYIPVFNVEQHVAACLESIFGQSYPLEEVLVVDDGSSDRSVEIAQQYPVRLIRHDRNKGLAAARNTAFQNAGAAFLGAFDTDATADPGYTKFAMMELENTADNVVGIGGSLIEHYTEAIPDKWRSFHLPQSHGNSRFVSPSFVCGSNNILLREAVLAIGGYNERHRTNGEDSELGNRLREAGQALALIPEAQAIHHRRDTIESLLRARWNYGYWFWHDQGVYESLPELAKRGEYLKAIIHAHMEDDMSAGHPDLVYLSFVCLFSDMIEDLRHAEAIGLLTEGERRFVAAELLQGMNHRNSRVPEPVRERVLADTAHLTRDLAGRVGEIRPECRALARAFSDAAVALCADLTVEQVAHMTATTAA